MTESFISLRRLENEILKELLGEKILLGEFDNPIKVSINQFYGIEINDFAVSVAQTALWIAELQMIQETQEIIHRDLNFLPLKSYANIFEGNALRMDWKNILPNDINFIFGNPPFVGKSFQTKEQKSDMAEVFLNIKNFGNLDYVACWYKKTADFIQNTNIQCAFVSTNSVCQGIAVPPLWKFLLNQKIFVKFAHQTFQWQSESKEKAAVHCVIVGFSNQNIFPKKLFTSNGVLECENINPYLLPAPNIIVEPQAKSFFDVPPMFVGSCPTDGGNLILSAEEREKILKKFPDAKKFIKIYLGSEEFIKNKIRYCLWLKNASPNEIKKCSPIYERVQAVKNFRLSSKKIQTQKRAETPHLFAEDRFIDEKKIFIPMVSSENRKYIPIDFVDADVVVNNKALFIPTENIFLFGILTSNVHMIWMKNFCGRLKSDFSYSATIIYNTFPFCESSEKNRKKIEQTAQNILDVRKKYPDAILADLYDPILMPKDLRDAHKKNDLAVMEAYGFDKNFSENEIVAELMKLYQNLTGEK